MRVALGCLRLPPDEALARATLEAARASGIKLFDTARAYGDENERLVGATAPRIVTKCGMRRPDGRWEPDGRANAILEDARKSRELLGRVPDLLLLHAPDPRVPLATSARTLARAKEDGLALSIGLSNVTCKHLEEAAEHMPIAAVEIALGAFDDAAARGGVVAWCASRSISVLAHSPLGGPERSKKLGSDPVLRAIAKRHDASAAEIVVAYLLALDEAIVPLVGASRPESARSAARANAIVLSAEDLAALDTRFPGLATVRHPVRPVATDGARAVTLVMGIPGAGKSRLAAKLERDGYERLNRDAIGGSLRGIARRLDERLRAGAARVVLDNTYVTRASRSDVIRVAHAHGVRVDCVFVDAPLHEAQRNVASRLLERTGGLALGKRDEVAVAPTALFRMVRELERPSADEGFASIEVVPFVREHVEGEACIVVPFESLPRARPLLPAGVPLFVYAWRPGGDAKLDVPGATAAIACTHPSGPPTCWCRPPLPGLFVAFARAHGIDARKSVLLAETPAQRTFAKNLGLTVKDIA